MDFVSFTKSLNLGGKPLVLNEWQSSMASKIDQEIIEKKGVTLYKNREVGATTFFSLYSVHLALTNPDIKIGYMIPLDMRVSGSRANVLQAFSIANVEYSTTPTEDVITFPNGSSITIFGNRRLDAFFDYFFADETMNIRYSEWQVIASRSGYFVAFTSIY